jgi:hypothetical protein
MHKASSKIQLQTELGKQGDNAVYYYLAAEGWLRHNGMRV